MAKYKAIKTFCGVELSMSAGEVKDILDDNIVSDLLRAGYIEQIKPAEKADTPKKGAKK